MTSDGGGIIASSFARHVPSKTLGQVDAAVAPFAACATYDGGRVRGIGISAATINGGGMGV
jgi:hypothetical protein